MHKKDTKEINEHFEKEQVRILLSQLQNFAVEIFSKINELSKNLTWFEIGHISIGMSLSFMILRASGCLVIEYPCPILVAFNKMASITLKSA